ncbi:MAG: hypothetical protein EZS28_018397, partial [Streblomastix strix]
LISKFLKLEALHSKLLKDKKNIQILEDLKQNLKIQEEEKKQQKSKVIPSNVIVRARATDSKSETVETHKATFAVVQDPDDPKSVKRVNNRGYFFEELTVISDQRCPVIISLIEQKVNEQMNSDLSGFGITQDQNIIDINALSKNDDNVDDEEDEEEEDEDEEEEEDEEEKELKEQKKLKKINDDKQKNKSQLKMTQETSLMTFAISLLDALQNENNMFLARFVDEERGYALSVGLCVTQQKQVRRIFEIPRIKLEVGIFTNPVLTNASQKRDKKNDSNKHSKSFLQLPQITGRSTLYDRLQSRATQLNDEAATLMEEASLALGDWMNSEGVVQQNSPYPPVIVIRMVEDRISYWEQITNEIHPFGVQLPNYEDGYSNQSIPFVCVNVVTKPLQPKQSLEQKIQVEISKLLKAEEEAKQKKEKKKQGLKKKKLTLIEQIIDNNDEQDSNDSDDEDIQDYSSVEVEEGRVRKNSIDDDIDDKQVNQNEDDDKGDGMNNTLRTNIQNDDQQNKQDIQQDPSSSNSNQNQNNEQSQQDADNKNKEQQSGHQAEDEDNQDDAPLTKFVKNKYEINKNTQEYIPEGFDPLTLPPITCFDLTIEPDQKKNSVINVGPLKNSMENDKYSMKQNAKRLKAEMKRRSRKYNPIVPLPPTPIISQYYITPLPKPTKQLIGIAFVDRNGYAAQFTSYIDPQVVFGPHPAIIAEFYSPIIHHSTKENLMAKITAASQRMKIFGQFRGSGYGNDQDNKNEQKMNLGQIIQKKDQTISVDEFLDWRDVLSVEERAELDKEEQIFLLLKGVAFAALGDDLHDKKTRAKNMRKLKTEQAQSDNIPLHSLDLNVYAQLRIDYSITPITGVGRQQLREWIQSAPSYRMDEYGAEELDEDAEKQEKQRMKELMKKKKQNESGNGQGDVNDALFGGLRNDLEDENGRTLRMSTIQKEAKKKKKMLLQQQKQLQQSETNQEQIDRELKEQQRKERKEQKRKELAQSLADAEGINVEDVDVSQLDDALLSDSEDSEYQRYNKNQDEEDSESETDPLDEFFSEDEDEVLLREEQRLMIRQKIEKEEEKKKKEEEKLLKKQNKGQKGNKEEIKKKQKQDQLEAQNLNQAWANEAQHLNDKEVQMMEKALKKKLNKLREKQKKLHHVRLARAALRYRRRELMRAIEAVEGLEKDIEKIKQVDKEGDNNNKDKDKDKEKNKNKDDDDDNYSEDQNGQQQQQQIHDGKGKKKKKKKGKINQQLALQQNQLIKQQTEVQQSYFDLLEDETLNIERIQKLEEIELLKKGEDKAVIIAQRKQKKIELNQALDFMDDDFEEDEDVRRTKRLILKGGISLVVIERLKEGIGQKQQTSSLTETDLAETEHIRQLNKELEQALERELYEKKRRAAEEMRREMQERRNLKQREGELQKLLYEIREKEENKLEDKRKEEEGRRELVRSVLCDHLVTTRCGPGGLEQQELEMNDYNAINLPTFAESILTSKVLLHARRRKDMDRGYLLKSESMLGGIIEKLVNQLIGLRKQMEAEDERSLIVRKVDKDHKIDRARMTREDFLSKQFREITFMENEDLHSFNYRKQWERKNLRKGE